MANPECIAHEPGVKRIRPSELRPGDVLTTCVCDFSQPFDFLVTSMPCKCPMASSSRHIHGAWLNAKTMAVVRECAWFDVDSWMAHYIYLVSRL